jgi:hypothetical protein
MSNVGWQAKHLLEESAGERLLAPNGAAVSWRLAFPNRQMVSSLPCAAKRLVLRPLAGWGNERERYASAASVQLLAETSPVTHESKDYSRAHRRYACIKAFHNVLINSPGK